MTAEHHLFSCTVCLEGIGNPHYSFDRRIEKVSVIIHEGKPVTSINIAYCESLFMYCSPECWGVHEPDIRAGMELTKTFPAFTFVTPCCKCGKAVNRTHHYVCYSISKMVFSDMGQGVISGRCLDDDTYAVLCRDCEGFDLAEEAVEALQRERESIT